MDTADDAPEVSFEQALASVGLAGVAVPEPAFAGIMLAGGALLARRRVP